MSTTIRKQILHNSAKAFVANLQQQLGLPVTKELAIGRIRSSMSCPIARSLQLKDFTTIVNTYQVSFYNKHKFTSTYTFEVPPAVSEFIKYIDSGLFPSLTTRGDLD